MSIASDVACIRRLFGFECMSNQSIIWGDVPVILTNVKQAQATISNLDAGTAVSLQEQMEMHLADWADHEGSASAAWSNEPGTEIYGFNTQLTYQEKDDGG